MTSLIDFKEIKELSFRPNTSESHKSVKVGSALYNAYIPQGATTVLMQASTNNVRFTLDGTNPTATFGFRLVAGLILILLDLNEHIQLKFFGEDASSVLEYCFGGQE